MKNLSNKLASIIVLFFAIPAISVVLADDFSTVSPSMLNLKLDQGQTTVEKVSLTIHPFCFRPYKVDVVASDPNAPATNLSGTVVNGCGGDESGFKIEFTGTGAPQSFDLQFIDAEFGNVLGSIPVKINGPDSKAEALLGMLYWHHAIYFQVASSGCTTKADFKVEVLESFPVQLRLVRLREDPCDAVVPLGTFVGFSYHELGLRSADKFRVINPLATLQVP